MAILCDTITGAVHQHNTEQIHRYTSHITCKSDLTPLRKHSHMSTRQCHPTRHPFGATMRGQHCGWIYNGVSRCRPHMNRSLSVCYYWSVRYLVPRYYTPVQHDTWIYVQSRRLNGRNPDKSKVLGSYQILSAQVTPNFTSQSSHFNRLLRRGILGPIPISTWNVPRPLTRVPIYKSK